ncbi:MAG TPA: C40 family peptidase [Ktedonobacterales bacterium]
MLAICVGVADVRREPDAESELVTQALMGAPAEPGTAQDGWQSVRLVDYEGWVRFAHLASAPTPSENRRVIVVTALSTPLFSAPEEPGAEKEPDEAAMLFLSTVLPLADLSGHPDLLKVALPGGTFGWVRAGDVAIRPADQPFPQAGVDTVIATAQRFLGTPYHWGGTTCQGIDCSGLVQLCFHVAGYHIPRDSRQQIAALDTEPVGVPAPGDLLFYAKEGRIVHVALSLGDWELIHAEGVKWNTVLCQSMDPAHADRYNHRLVELYCGARRVLPINSPDFNNTDSSRPTLTEPAKA